MLSDSVTSHVTRVVLPVADVSLSETTNTYIVHSGGEYIVVDAGAMDPDVLEQFAGFLVSAGFGQPIALVGTHYHHDHVLGLSQLREFLKVPLFLHQADIDAWKSGLSDAYAAPALISVGDVEVALALAKGHTHGHLHLRVPADDLILVGDTLSGYGTVWVGPPDGHLDDYYDTLEELSRATFRLAAPGHGPIITDVAAAARHLLQRRQARGQDIAKLLQHTWMDVESIVDTIYGDTVPNDVRFTAVRTVLAHLEQSRQRGQVTRRYVGGDTVFEYHGLPVEGPTH